MANIKFLSVAGARPNFMKLASLSGAIDGYNQELNSISLEQRIDHIIVHTGQHYDKAMSQQFFDNLGIPTPDMNLEVGSGSHASQTAEIMKKFEPVLLKEKPDAMLVVGDVNSTIACSLVASKIQYPSGCSLERPLIAHVEAGLRSFDRSMPEEINRVLTDAISDLLFVTEEEAITNLKREGIDSSKVYHVGNVMIDTLQKHLIIAEKSQIKEKLNIDGSYGMVTLHRPSNVDSVETLKPLMDCLMEIAGLSKMIFPVHPRTLNNLNKFGLLQGLQKCDNLMIIEPLDYLEFLNLMKDAVFVLTDSGGIQEETTYLKVPCVTLRDNTERPVTVDIGSNYLIGTEVGKILSTVDQIVNGGKKDSRIPELWDGQAGKRIILQIVKTLEEQRKAC